MFRILPTALIHYIATMLYQTRRLARFQQACKLFHSSALPIMLKRREVHALFQSFTRQICDLFQGHAVDIAKSARSARILDTSMYAPADSREIQIVLYPDCLGFTYDIPRAASTRAEHENHWIVFIPHGIRSGMMRIYKKPFGHTELGYCAEPATVVIRRFELPWQPETMDL